MQKMQDYLRYRRMLAAKLDEVKNELRRRITDAYKETEEQLVNIAKEQSVPYASNVDSVIIIKTQPQNIANLKLNLNTDEYYKTQAAKILSAVTPSTPAPTDTPQQDGTQTPVQQVRRVKNIHLNTRSSSKIATAQDVDNYLSKLRAQLMQHIDNGEEIIVL